MSLGKAECTCKSCGATFIKSKNCRNTREAAEYVSFAADYFDECPHCYSSRIKKEREENADAIIKKYNLPDITGVSEKQINYAVDLRNKYLANHKKEIESMDEPIEKAKILMNEKYNGDIDLLISDCYKSIDPDIRMYELTHMSSLKAVLLVFVKLFTMTSASEIIKSFT